MHSSSVTAAAAPTRSAQRLHRVALAVLCVLAALGAFALFGSGGGDDSHITWWVVDELRRTGRILNLNGAAIEQSSSLALVLVVAALRVVLPIPTPALGVILSLLATSATCWMTARVARRFEPSLQLPAALLVATSGPLLYWGTSGMETALAAFAGVWLLDAIAACIEALPAAARRVSALLELLVASTLFITVRPENHLLILGLLAPGVALAFRYFQLHSSDRAALRFLGLCLLAVALPIVGLFAWRHAAFHAWFPHPVTAKAGGPLRWAAGWKYLVQHTTAFQPVMFVLLPISVIGALLASVKRRTEPLAVFVVVLAALGVSFIIASGGDWMSCGRFLASQLPIWWLLFCVCLSLNLTARPKLGPWVVVALAAANLWFLFGLTRSGGTNGYPLNAALKVVPAARQQYGLEQYSFAELSNKSHLRDALLAEELKRVIAQVAPEVPGKIWLASGQAGAVPYHVFPAFPGRLRFIDFWGLTSAEALPCIPKSKLVHSSLGVAMSPELMFKYRAAIWRDCGIPMADIVFNTSFHAGTQKGLEARGYRVVYFQRGAMPSFHEPSQLRGGTSIDAYIAVRRQLADQVHLVYRELRWSLAG